MQIAITGITGNMGQAVLKHIIDIKEIDNIKLLVLEDDKRIKKILKKYAKYKDKLNVMLGNLKDFNKCEELVKGCSYVINLAAVIPPHSDQEPKKAIECNEIGVNNLVTAIEKIKFKQPRFIHISTVALYGNRNHRHPWGRVGDPLLVSPFDIYSVTKMRGEFRVLESDIENFVVLRQTAMLHENMLNDNMSDGLMFHTCFNAPLDWVTANNSGLLIANILKRDITEDLSKVFWRKCFNISGGERNCVTGYDTLNDGFAIIGGSVKDFFKPNYNATRNFHGVWFYDGEKLNDLFNYQSESVDFFWRDFAKNHSYLKAGKIVPKSLISKFAIQRLFKSENSPKYWLKNHDDAKVFAYFKGYENYDKIGEDWSNFDLLIENRADGQEVDYKALKDKSIAKLIDYKFDYTKNDDEIDIDDLKAVAKAHGGKLLTQAYNKGDMRSKLEWQTSEGDRFFANAYTVLRAGHWMNDTYKKYCWNFDKLAKQDEIYAQIWFDSHDEDENQYYYFDENFNAHAEKRD